MPKRCGCGTGAPLMPATPGRVDEPELLDRDRRRERHDRELDAADAQRGDAISSPSDRGDERADQRRERKADPASVGEVRDDEAGDAGEGQLDDRDLADEAGDHDQREDQRPRRSRVHQRLAEVEGQDDQRDTAGDQREHGGPQQTLGARHERQALLDVLAAPRQARAAQEERDAP